MVDVPDGVPGGTFFELPLHAVIPKVKPSNRITDDNKSRLLRNSLFLLVRQQKEKQPSNVHA